MFKRVLFLAISLTAILSMLLCAQAADANTYTVCVDIGSQITTVYRNSDGAIVRQMICSTGVSDTTPRGTFRLQQTRESTDRKEWYYISEYRCYVKYATRIKGGILFHSIPYTAMDMDSIDATALAQLGTQASHGCIRLRWEDARWIAMNCPDGTEVRIFTGLNRRTALRDLLLETGFAETPSMSYAQFAAQAAGETFEALGRGDDGEEVAALQARLACLGFYHGPSTGSYNEATVVAVTRFQVAAGLSPTGIATRAVFDRLFHS